MSGEPQWKIELRNRKKPQTNNNDFPSPPPGPVSSNNNTRTSWKSNESTPTTPTWRNGARGATNDNNPTPPWKKPVETPTPVSAPTPSSVTPAWKMKNGGIGGVPANNDKPIPPWKSNTPSPINTTPPSPTPSWKTKNSANNDKPIPPWKSSNPSPVNTTPCSPTPSWKASNSGLAASNDKPIPPWKSNTPSPINTTPPSPTPSWKMKNSANNDKPIPPWKGSSTPSPVSTTPSSATPPWKMNNGGIGALSLADKLKQQMAERKKRDQQQEQEEEQTKKYATMPKPQSNWPPAPPPATEKPRSASQLPVTPMKPQPNPTSSLHRVSRPSSVFSNQGTDVTPSTPMSKEAPEIPPPVQAKSWLHSIKRGSNQPGESNSYKPPVPLNKPIPPLPSTDRPVPPTPPPLPSKFGGNNGDQPPLLPPNRPPKPANGVPLPPPTSAPVTSAPVTSPSMLHGMISSQSASNGISRITKRSNDFPLPPPTDDFLPPPPDEFISSLPPPPTALMSPPSPQRPPAIPSANKKPTYIRPKMAIPNRRPLPADIDSRPPPDKPGKPAIIRGTSLMYQSRKLPPPPPAGGRSKPDAPSLPNRNSPSPLLTGPPLPGGKPPGMGPPLPGGKPPGMGPPLPGGKPPGMIPPIPGGKPPGMIPPPPPAKPQNMAMPPLPVKPGFVPSTIQRNSQLHTNRASIKSTMSSVQGGDIYDDTAGDMIETWEDEDETEALYDDTADLPPPPIPDASQRGSFSSSLYTDTAAPHLPSITPRPSFSSARQSVVEATPDDTYEVFGGEGPADDTYETFEPCAAPGPPQPVVTDKKKEKEMRKKFKLPKEGDIEAQSKATVQNNAKGGGKDLQVTSGEVVEVIKLNDCPKKKWLIRNSLGVYGYVDSSNVKIDAALLQLTASRYSAKRPESTCSSDKIQEEIYDDTAVPPPEDLYEEL